MNANVAQSYVAGKWLANGREKVKIVNPFSGNVIGEQILASVRDIETAISAAYAAKKDVAKIPSHERAEILNNAARLLNKDKERFARLIAMELGKPLKNTLNEVVRSIETLEQSGAEAKNLRGETLPGDASSRGTKAMAITFRVPVGVVGAITPFNAPLNLVCHKVGPAFAGGNSVILKPAPQTSLVATEFLKLLLDAGFPAGAINMVIGGVDAGRQIVRDERINVISFTGSVLAGKNICDLAGMRRVLLELGGNASTIVHEDADLRRAANLCASSGFSNSGQSCISVQRIYVHKPVVSRFMEFLKEEVSKLKVGDPLLRDTDVGCLVDTAAARRVESWISEALDAGAEIICGGTRNGATVAPTVLFNPPRTSKVVCQEVFGPVVSVVPYKDVEEAIKETNNSTYGLQAGIFTNKLDLAYRVAASLEVGGVIINGTSNFRLDHWPYGGIKDSGIGREGPRYAIQEMTDSKMIVFQIPEEME